MFVLRIVHRLFRLAFASFSMPAPQLSLPSSNHVTVFTLCKFRTVDYNGVGCSVRDSVDWVKEGNIFP
jgi:hypothetical protein